MEASWELKWDVDKRKVGLVFHRSFISSPVAALGSPLSAKRRILQVGLTAGVVFNYFSTNFPEVFFSHNASSDRIYRR